MKLKLTAEQETQLLGAITATFGSKKFDATSIAVKARNSGTPLAEALQAIIPSRTKWWHPTTVRRVLWLMEGRFFDIGLVRGGLSEALSALGRGHSRRASRLME